MPDLLLLCSLLANNYIYTHTYIFMSSSRIFENNYIERYQAASHNYSNTITIEMGESNLIIKNCTTFALDVMNVMV